MDPLILTLGVAPVGALAAATLGAGSAAVLGVYPSSDFAYGWTIWWLRNWAGVVLVSALVFAWTRSRPIAWSWARGAEMAALVAIVLSAGQLMFGLWEVFGTRNVPLAFIFFPIVGWAGLRFGARGASTIVAIVAVFATAIAALGVGPFAAFSVSFTQVLLFTYLMLSSLSGHVLAAVIAERDEALARRLVLEEQLRHSQKMEAVGRLAGGIAHDFNNLLTAIIGYTEIVLPRSTPRTSGGQTPRRLDGAAMRAADLTRQLLAFSRRQVLQPKVIDLNIALGKVEPMLRRLIGEDIELTITPKATRRARARRPRPGRAGGHEPGGQRPRRHAAGRPAHRRDRRRHPGRGGHGRLSPTPGRDRTSCCRSPTPASACRPRCARASSSRSSPPRTWARAPAWACPPSTASSGRATATSRCRASWASAPRSASTCRGPRPSRRLSATSAPRSCPRAPSTSCWSRTTRRCGGSRRNCSRGSATRVTEAASGRAGLALGSDDTRHFDLALCDVILGDMSGPAVAEALQALRPSIRVLYMSGYTDEAIVKTGVLDEGKPFLQKPFTPLQLARKIRDVLDEPGAGSM